MENKNTNVDNEVTITLKSSEIFQLNLSVISRLGYVQQKWANAATEQEQTASEHQMAYLSKLSSKLQNVLKEI